MQWFVNHAPRVIDEQIGLGPIDWRSPLRDDEYAEYRDAAFLERIGVTLPKRPLEAFWPRGGPQWDALGRAATSEAVIVEAKAHLNELYSPATGASESSLALVRASLAEAAASMNVPAGFDWSKQFYQYANRLAHAYLLDHVRCSRETGLRLFYWGHGHERSDGTKRVGRCDRCGAHGARPKKLPAVCPGRLHRCQPVDRER
jgi:hypothetical protein